MTPPTEAPEEIFFRDVCYIRADRIRAALTDEVLFDLVYKFGVVNEYRKLREGIVSAIVGEDQR